MKLTLSPELLVEAYAQGLFPMAHSGGSDQIHWICPEERGQLSITGLHIPKSLQKTVLKNIKRNASYNIKINSDFEGVIRACAEISKGRKDTWINDEIIKAYCVLHKRGFAHSVEVWDKDALLGGLYGVSLGGVFCGESMFSRATDTSKIALVHLCARLWKGGYSILDTQFVNDHLKQFGVYEVPHAEYLEQLHNALRVRSDFYLDGLSETELISAYFEMRAAEKP